ncbi:MAG: DUF2791 family P-loop domain-containing protein, partial [Candidatus Bathyarchaeota archaeon]
MHSKILSEPKLVGREKELAQLDLSLKNAIEGKGTTIFVSGEAGTGKTRLIETFLEKAKKKDLTVLSGWCLSEVTTPYLPFIEAFNTYNAISSKEQKSLSQKQNEFQFSVGENLYNVNKESKIPTMGTGSQTIQILQKPLGFSPQIWRDRLFSAIVDKIHSISSKKPLILFIDDIHWADSASLALLHYIARAVKNSERVIVLGTFRSDELVADVEGHPHPLAEIIRMMRREDLFTEIKLSNLSNIDLAKIAEDMIGGNLNLQFVEKLAAESKGNPLFIIESLRMLSEHQGLIFENNQWRLSITELGLPTKIKDIILRRLSVLDYYQRRVLDVAATIGEKFNIKILSAVLGKDDLEILETLNIIAHSTRLVSVEENYYKFDHERSRKTVYESIASPLKQGYHAKIAKILESSKDVAFHLSDLAYHYAQAGNKEKAIKYALVAAKDELAKFSNQQAIQHFKYVLRNIEQEQVKQKNDALEGLGDAYAANSMYEEAIKTFDKLAVSDIGLIRLRALRKATDAAFHKWDKPDILLEYAKKAEELASLNRLEMGRIINNRGRAFSLSGRGDLRQDLEDYNTALEIFEEENSLADIADALWRSGILTCALGSLREGLSRLLRSIAIFREIGDIRKEAEANLAAAQIFFGLGFFSVALSKYSIVHVLGEKLGMFNELAQASYGLSLIYEHYGNIREALSQALKVIDYNKKTDANIFATDKYASLVRLYCKLGDFDNADKAYKIMIETASKEFNRTRSAGKTIFSNIDSTKAVYLTVKGHFEESNMIFENHLKLFKSPFPVAGYEVRNREDYAWTLEKQGKVEEAKAQIEKTKILLKNVEKKHEYANVQLNVLAPRLVNVEESFEIRLDIVNIGKNAAKLAKVVGVSSSEFKTSCSTFFCSQRNNEIEIESKKVNGFDVETIKLSSQTSKPGSYTLNPEITYVSNLGETRKSKAKPLNIKVEESKPKFRVLPDRISTGSLELDQLLLGGIPENYAVVLTGSPSDEREVIIKNFLEEGTKEDQITFFVSTEAVGMENLLGDPNFYLFLCNPKPKTKVTDLPNVYKLRSKTDLTNLSISLAKAFRNIEPSKNKRICIETVSDILLEYGAKATRKWVSEQINDLGSKGFTMLTVINPLMHSSEDLHAILGLFDGEIELALTGDPLEYKKSIRVKKLRSKTDLTNLSISLAKAFRNIEPSKNKRICIETVSDILLEYGAKATRK